MSVCSTAAHSLGNVVASSAIANAAFPASRYYMINAAVPIEAYSSAQTHGEGGVPMLQRMTEDSWKPYRDLEGSDKLFADGWHTLFTDGRRALTWADRFRNALGIETYNFYSSGEDVVENALESELVSGNIWSVIEETITLGNNGRHAWVAQEIAKGSHEPFIAAALGLQHGGWAYNPVPEYGDEIEEAPYWWPYGPEQAGGLLTEKLRAEPFFRRFQAEDSLFGEYDGTLLYGPDEPGGAAGEHAKKLSTQFKLLAEAIPARSFAAAANRLEPLETYGDNNFDMMDYKNDNKWTTERPVEVNGSRPWWHSDFRAVALVYTSPMWKKMIGLGGLDQ